MHDWTFLGYCILYSVRLIFYWSFQDTRHKSVPGTGTYVPGNGYTYIQCTYVQVSFIRAGSRSYAQVVYNY